MVSTDLSVTRAECFLVVSTLGANLRSWNISGREFLFVSSAPDPVSDGMPLVFPHFGEWGDKPLHGFARLMPWTVDEAFRKENPHGIRLLLRDSEETRRIWNHSFELIYDLSLVDDSGQMNVKFAVKNTDQNSFEFNQLFHPYFKVDVQNVKISGLQGKSYLDKTDNFKEKIEARQDIVVDRHMDYVYKDTGSPQVLQDGQKRITIIKSPNLRDMVIWNPRKKGESFGFAKGEDDTFVCVEPGNVNGKMTLSPGEVFVTTWSAKAEILGKP